MGPGGTETVVNRGWKAEKKETSGRSPMFPVPTREQYRSSSTQFCQI